MRRENGPRERNGRKTPAVHVHLESQHVPGGLGWPAPVVRPEYGQAERHRCRQRQVRVHRGGTVRPDQTGHRRRHALGQSDTHG